jgi:hypothetical protein
MSTNKALAIPAIATKPVKITDNTSMANAVEVLSQLNKLAKDIKNERELITKPMNEALDEVRSRYKPVETKLAEAIATVRAEMTRYQTEQQAIEDAKKLKIDEKVASGKMKFETGIRKREEIITAPVKVVATAGAVKFRTMMKFEITNIKLIPHEYLLPNESMIRTAQSANVPIAGVRYYTEQIPVNRTV